MAADHPIRTPPPNAANLTGRRFGRLVVLGFSGERRSRAPLWVCQCDCGNFCFVRSTDLTNHSTRSCGCLAREESAARLLKHGLAHGDLYRIWERMISRCHNPVNPAFADYGGRGIKVCQRWRDSVQAFVADMGKRPSRKYSVNRKDNNGDYEPSNCEWATDLEQARNTRRNHFITLNGETLCLSAWCERLKIKGDCFHSRLKRGWSEEEALTIPVGSPRLKH